MFYASAFQSGVDKFLVPSHEKVRSIPRSAFVAERTALVPRGDWEIYHQLVNASFSSQLPYNWGKEEKYFPVVRLMYFVVEALYSMHIGASLLWIHVPDFKSMEALLPSSLRTPFSILFGAIIELNAKGVVQQKILSTYDAQRFMQVLSSDLFQNYSLAQSRLDDMEVEVRDALPEISLAAERLVVRGQRLLLLRDGSLGVLEMTPKLIEAAFGKLPGALADVAAKLGISFLESRRRLVIYDLGDAYDMALFGEIARMAALGGHHLLAAKEQIQDDGQTDLGGC